MLALNKISTPPFNFKMWCPGGHLFLIFFCASHLPPAPATSPAHTINSLRQMMDHSQATAIKLEALKDVYNDPPRGTVKTIITDDEQVVDFVKIEEQPAFDHPLLKDHKIQADNGDIIDYVDIYKQPAYHHPLMKNHTLQLEPTWQEYGDTSNDAKLESIFDMSWQKHGGCPKGSVPIVRPFLSDDKIMRKNICSRYPDPSASLATGHQYAVIHYHNNGQPTIQGASATVSIWNPQLALPNSDFSLSQIWITSGNGSNLQTIEAGWQVFPGRTGSGGPKLFIYSTPDNYRTGCYDYGINCTGWVQTSQQYSPGMSLRSSTYGTEPSELAMNIRRDPCTGNWWLSLWGTPIGYWPPFIFKGGLLGTCGADTVSWGGEIYDSSGSNGFSTWTQMGSGHFASEGYRKASYVKEIFFTDYCRNCYAPRQDQLRPSTPAPNCYNYMFQRGLAGHLYFFYGGPGCY